MLEFQKLVKEQAQAKKAGNEALAQELQMRIQQYGFRDPAIALTDVITQIANPLTPDNEQDLIECLTVLALNCAINSSNFPMATFFDHIFLHPNAFTEKWLQQLPIGHKYSYFYSLMADPHKARTFIENTKWSQEDLETIYLSLATNQPEAVSIFEQPTKLISEVTVKTKETIQSLAKGELTLEHLQAIPAGQINENVVFEEACAQSKLDMVTMLLQKGTISAKSKQNGLLRLLFKIPKTIPLQLLQDHGVQMNQAFPDLSGPMVNNLTPLLFAVKTSRADLIDEMLNLKGDININHIVTKHHDIGYNISPPGRTALSFSLERYPDISLVTRLIEKGADVNLPANQPLEFAMNQGNQEVIALLLSKGARLSQAALEQKFNEALQFRDLVKIKQLLNIGGIELLTTKPFIDYLSNFPLLIHLYYSITSPQDEVQFLNTLQAILNVPQKLDKLHNLNSFDELLRAPQSPMFKKIIQILPQDKLSLVFRTLIPNHDAAFLNQFLDAVEPQDTALMDKLYLSCLDNLYITIDSLQALFVEPKRRVSESAYQSALVARRFREPDITPEQCQTIVTDALAKGANVQVIFEQACLVGKNETIRTLLANPNHKLATNTKGPMLAVLGGVFSHNISTVALLLENHFSFDKMAMSFAFDARSQFPELLTTLLDSDASLDVNPERERSLLMTSIEEYQKDVTKKLIKHGANVNYPDDKPLIRALEQHHFDIAELLVQKGATLAPEIFGFYFVQAMQTNNAQLLKLLMHLGSPKAIPTTAFHYDITHLLANLFIICQDVKEHDRFLDCFQLIQRLDTTKAANWPNITRALLWRLLSDPNLNKELFAKWFALIPRNKQADLVLSFLNEPSTSLKLIEMGDITDQKLLDGIYLKGLTILATSSMQPPYDSLNRIFITPVCRVSNSAMQTGRALRALQSSKLSVERLSAFIEQGADPSILLVEACQRGNLEITKQLLKTPVDEAAREEAFWCALVNTSSLFTPLQLEEAGFNFDHIFAPPRAHLEMTHTTPLQLMLSNKVPAPILLAFLNETRSDLHLNHTSTGDNPVSAVKSALLLAIQYSDATVVNKLLAMGADPNIPNGEPLKFALETGNPEILQPLYEKGARLSQEYLKQQMRVWMSDPAYESRFNALLGIGGEAMLKDPDIINAAMTNPQIYVLNHYIKNPDFKTHLPYVFRQAINMNRPEIVDLLLKEGYQPNFIELNEQFKHAISTKEYAKAQILYNAGARIDSQAMRSIILGTIKKNYQSSRVSISDTAGLQFMLSIWPEKPFNDRTVIDHVINNDIILASNFTDENTHIDQRKYLYQVACERGNSALAKKLIDKFDTPDTLQQAMTVAIQTKDTIDTAILDHLHAKGTKAAQDQVATLLSKKLNAASPWGHFNRTKKGELTKYLKYCPTPLTDVKVVDDLFTYQDHGLISVLLTHGVSDALKARIYNFTLPKAVPQVAPQVAPQAVQPAVDPEVAALREELGLEDEPEVAPAAANNLLEQEALHPQVEAAIDEALELLDAPNPAAAAENLAAHFLGQFNAPQAAAIAPPAPEPEAVVHHAAVDELLAQMEFPEPVAHVVVDAQLAAIPVQPLNAIADQHHPLAWFGQNNAPPAANFADGGMIQGPIPPLFDADRNLNQNVPAKQFHFIAANLALEAGYKPTADEVKQMAEKASAALLDAYKNNDLARVAILKKLGGTLTENAKKEILITAIQRSNINTFNEMIPGTSLNDVDIIDAVLKNPQPIFIEAILNIELNRTQLQKLFLAAHKNNNLDLANRILAKGFTPTELDWHQVLLIAIEQGDKEAVIRLLTDGVSARFNQSEALSKAVTSPRPKADIVQALLDSGADPKIQGCFLPLKAIASYGEHYHTVYLDIAQMLMNRIVPDQDLSDAFNHERQGTIQFAEFKSLVFDTIKASLKPHEKIAFELLAIREIMRARSAEYAGDESLSRKANAHFQAVVEPALKDKFNRVQGNSPLDKVANIEKDIKAFLLAEILATCKQNPSPRGNELIAYIENNRSALVEGRDQAIMQGMRQLATSNEDSAQIAWRAYDPGATYNRNWENLLTPRMENTTVYTTAAASGGALSVRIASELARYRIAMYFLAIGELNKENFIQQIADMRRANAIDERDCPSCYPGTIGRIGKLGAGHPRFQLPPERREIIHQQISALTLKQFSDMTANMKPDDINDLYQSLVMLGTLNAEDIIAGKVYYDEDWTGLRETFIGSLGATATIKDRINAALKAENEPDLGPRDDPDFNKELKDIAGGDTAMELGVRFKAAKARLGADKSEEQKPAEPLMVNPYVITPTSVPAMLPPERKKTMMDNRMKRFIEFEILFEVCKQQLPEIKSEAQIDLIKEIVDVAFSMTPTDHSALKEVCNSAIAKYETNLKLTPAQSEALTQQILRESSLQGLSNEQAESLKEKVINKQLTKDNAIFNELLKGSCTRVVDEIVSRTPPRANKPSV